MNDRRGCDAHPLFGIEFPLVIDPDRWVEHWDCTSQAWEAGERPPDWPDGGWIPDMLGGYWRKRKLVAGDTSDAA